jgi:hypothetical protein
MFPEEMSHSKLYLPTIKISEEQTKVVNSPDGNEFALKKKSGLPDYPESHINMRKLERACPESGIGIVFIL